tara:strand:- start:853 stop:1074 length:222 start_codon:yes stop_codon:yes gene_type:complete
MIMKFFTKHLKEVNETYFTHMKYALLISARMQIAAYAQILHAIFPFIHPPLGGDVKSMEKFLINQKYRGKRDE